MIDNKPFIKAGAASIKLTDDNMTELGGSVQAFPKKWEGEFRASALILESVQKVCIVSLDALIVPQDVADSAVKRIAVRTGIPESNILICATHTHGGPSPINFLGLSPDKEFLRRLEEGSVLAAVKASAAMNEDTSSVELLFGHSQEATVGRNSRLLLKDGMVGWYGYNETDIVRPTGPYDPDLYVLALRRRDGTFAGLAFNHSTHNLGKIQEDCLSPCFYGLSAQETARRHHAVTLFLPGAFGSTHNCTFTNSGVSPTECVHRVVGAVEDSLSCLQSSSSGTVSVLRRGFDYKIRRFDEGRESAAVSNYMKKYAPQESAEAMKVFRKMRDEMVPHQGETRRTYIQIIRLGQIVFVGIPGELFARLGLDLRYRSPFRHTCIIGLSGGYIGYIPDRQAYIDGGYQTWAGWHSPLEEGTGEAMVAQVLEMLKEVTGR